MFNWATEFQHIPSEWNDTEGACIRIAVLDSGIDLTHEALIHLDVEGHKFDVTKENFDQDDIGNGGNDDVSDPFPSGTPHGTKITSIIAAKNVNGTGVQGMAPQAEIYHIKITDANVNTYLEYFVRGIQVALHFDVDLICTSTQPVFRNPRDAADSEQIFEQIMNSSSAIISTLINTRILEKLNDLKYPSSKEGCIVTGVVKDGLIEVLDTSDHFNSNIHSLMTETQVEYCLEANKYGSGKLTSSYGTACLTGLSALILSHWKRVDNPPRRRTRQELTDALDNLLNPLSVSALRAEDPKILRSYETQILP